ncbi:hypothetical protein EYR41_007007 [Orbilia oligospora]|uniref:Uncharacterized protein n=1 Tax=Orbilia oligospora TaxID=2813651 RepID=A0A8H2DZY8_ORBOL|nr:hypothetical protein EYR41_007007 [Orbilia oligospora]
MCEVWIYTWQCGHEGKDRKIQTLCDLASQVGVCFQGAYIQIWIRPLYSFEYSSLVTLPMSLSDMDPWS